jgi:hypothetical protein
MKRQCAAVLPGEIRRLIDAPQPPSSRSRHRMGVKHVEKRADILRNIHGHLRRPVHTPHWAWQTGGFVSLRNPAATFIVDRKR